MRNDASHMVNATPGKRGGLPRNSAQIDEQAVMAEVEGRLVDGEQPHPPYAVKAAVVAERRHIKTAQAALDTESEASRCGVADNQPWLEEDDQVDESARLYRE